jgi:hypothetical protein
LNRALLILLLWIALGLELGLKEALRLRDLPIAPSFVFCCLTLVAMFASPQAVRWTALAVGLMMDLLSVLSLRDSLADVRILGPNMLGFLVGCEVIMLVRGSTIRRNPLTLGFLAGTGALASAVVLVCIFTLRAWILDPLTWNLWFQTWTRSLSAIYTGLLGIVLAFALLPLAPLLGMQTSLPSLGGGRASRW